MKGRAVQGGAETAECGHVKGGNGVEVGSSSGGVA
jgi:hypothetical protein